MEPRDLKGLINRVKSGGLSRRRFIQRMAAAGLTAPMATQILSLDGLNSCTRSRSISRAIKPRRS